MKKYLMFIVPWIWLCIGTAFAGPPSMGSSSGGVKTSTECDAAAYYPMGTLCQDTDDGKLYKGTGAAVVEIAAGAAGAVATDTIWAAAGDLVQGTGNDTSAVLTAGTLGAYLRSGGAAAANVWSTLILPNAGSAFYLPAFTSANTMGQLAAAGASGEVLAGVTGAIPAWSANPSLSTLNIVGANALNLGTSRTNDGEIRFKSGTALNDYYFWIKGANFLTADRGWTMPTAAPAQNSSAVLSSTAGVLSYSTYALPAADCTENQILKANVSGDFVCAADATGGGTTIVNDTLWAAEGDIVIATANDTGAVLTKGAEGTILRAGAARPAYSTSTFADTYAIGTLLHASGANAVTGLGAGATTEILVGGGAAAPVWTTATGTGAPVRAGSPTFTGTVTMPALTVSPSATPTMTFGDSDAPGADKEVAKIVGAYIDGADGAENGTLGLYAMEGGTDTLYWLVDGKNIINSVLKPLRMSSTTQLQFGDTGTYINQSADGILNVASDTELKLLINDEDLKFTKTGTNGITLGTNTGVTMITTALNLVSTGTIQGGVVISSDADGMDAAAMTAAGVRGTMFIATGAGTWILPRAVLGDSLCLMDSGTAHDLILDVTAGSTIRLKGTEQADAVGITNASGSTTGDLICVIAVATDKWSTVGMQGTWASQ